MTTDSALWTIEFAASTAGHAQDLCRQAAGGGRGFLEPSQAGRLGYQATGGRDAIRELEEFLAARGEAFYTTRNG